MTRVAARAARRSPSAMSSCAVREPAVGLRCVLLAAALLSGCAATSRKCSGSAQPLKYLWGDALSDPADCVGPNGDSYPASKIARTFRTNNLWGSQRSGRSLRTLDPHIVQQTLINNYQRSNMVIDDSQISRKGRSGASNSVGYGDTCQGRPARLCRTRYNTTAPMYGVSLTSGQPVAIVQKFPDLLQQVVFEVCESTECDVVRGECTQTYVPYLFLVIPLGPVTLTGQDYVLVESGCVCKPKHLSVASSESSAVSTIPQL
ncbi:uncharacterized protein LOC134528832 [Bacillus rossius redtenbacheri]|uniref:uncharacterized protein LOC134528832 n=1 Tax=Bacillus rossius redtenbacheri TaxID=93214 RepID=UPI002FDE9784